MSRLEFRVACWLITLCGLVSVQQLIANPVKFPRRLVNNQAVDLNPLFKWWTNRAGPRPLTAWVRVTGTVVGTNSWGWVVEAKPEPGQRSQSSDPVESERKGSGKILLLHPPLQDLTEFERLKAELQMLNGNRKALVQREAETKAQAEAIIKEEKVVGHKSPQARTLSQEAKQLTLNSEQAKSQVKLLDSRIQPLKQKLAIYTGSDRYVVDCFALETGREAHDFSVYDHGSVFQ